MTDNPYLDGDLKRDASIADSVRLEDVRTHLNVCRNILRADLDQGRQNVSGAARASLQTMIYIIERGAVKFNATEVADRVDALKVASVKLNKAPLTTEMFEQSVSNLERDHLAECFRWCREADRACRDEIMGGKS